ncbi:MAG: alpha/beta hydrolase [Clostridia bacterium]|nr:alpha/beta hydrolase [Clostridia bacterium]
MKTSVYKTQEGKDLILSTYAQVLKDWPIPYDKHMVNTHYGITHAMTCGNPQLPPLVLIHGSNSNNFCWIGDIKTYTRTHYVYLIDIIGEANYSAENRPKYASGTYELWINEIMEYFQIKEASFVGLSLGGWMALTFASKYPQKVNRLVLMSMGGLAPIKFSFFVKLMYYSIFSKNRDEKIMKLLNGGKLPDLSDQGLKKALEFTALINRYFYPRMESLPLFEKPQLESLLVPTLIYYGEQDALLNPLKSIQLLEGTCHNARGVLLKDTGHVITGITKEIIKFLQGEKNETSQI